MVVLDETLPEAAFVHVLVFVRVEDREGLGAVDGAHDIVVLIKVELACDATCRGVQVMCVLVSAVEWEFKQGVRGCGPTSKAKETS